MTGNRRLPRAVALELDRSLPVLLMRIGNYPLHHGTLGVVRTLGRAGVPVYSVAERPRTPAAHSRYSSGTFVLPTTGREPSEQLMAAMRRMSEVVGRRSLVVCTDDEAAVFVAEHQHELADRFVVPSVPPTLSRVLASKLGLARLCAEMGVPAPGSAAPRTRADLEAFCATSAFPLMVKNLEAFTRLTHPAVPANTVVSSRDRLDALASSWTEPYSVLVQEYVPPEVAEDWIVHTCFGEDSAPRATFTGFKIRSWPPYAGVTTCGRTARNDELAELSDRFCHGVGYRGIADLDWRYDQRDGLYKLLDFNPRVGAQFRLFESAAGVDVVRAQHLEASGRPVPASPVRDGLELVLEHLDPVAIAGYLRCRRPVPPPPVARRAIRLAWAAPDDPLPALTAYALAGRQLGERLLRRGARGIDPAAVASPPITLQTVGVATRDDVQSLACRLEGPGGAPITGALGAFEPPAEAAMHHQSGAGRPLPSGRRVRHRRRSVGAAPGSEPVQPRSPVPPHHYEDLPDDV